MTEDGQWLEQWNLVLRSHTRWRDLRSGVSLTTDVDTTYLRDDLLSFFQHAYHLKDWLGNDPESGVSKPEAEAIIDSSEALRLCADLCNGTKHRNLYSNRSGRGPRLGTGTVALNVGGGAQGIRLTGWDIHLDDGTITDGLELAREVVEAWRTALVTRGLLP